MGLHAAEETGAWGVGLGLLRGLQRNGLRVGALEYEEVVRALGRGRGNVLCPSAGPWEVGMGLLGEMRERGMVPSEYLVERVFTAYLQSSDVGSSAQALRLMNRGLSSGALRANAPDLYASIMGRAFTERNWAVLFAIHGRLIDNCRPQPRWDLSNILIAANVAQGHWMRAIEFWMKARDAGLTPLSVETTRLVRFSAHHCGDDTLCTAMEEELNKVDPRKDHTPSEYLEFDEMFKTILRPYGRQDTPGTMDVPALLGDGSDKPGLNTFKRHRPMLKS